jgi:hypothetical protein
LRALEQRGELSGNEWEALSKELELATKEKAKALWEFEDQTLKGGKHTHAQQLHRRLRHQSLLL